MILLLLLMIVIDYLELSASLKCLPSIKCSLGVVKINMEKKCINNFYITILVRTGYLIFQNFVCDQAIYTEYRNLCQY